MSKRIELQANTTNDYKKLIQMKDKITYRHVSKR